MNNVKRIAQVTLPAISRKGHPKLYVYFLSELKRSEVSEGEDIDRKPATVARVINLEDGGEYNYVASALAVSALQQYPGGYVGKCFEINHSADKIPGKDYYGVDIYEIERPAHATNVLAVPKETQ